MWWLALILLTLITTIIGVALIRRHIRDRGSLEDELAEEELDKQARERFGERGEAVVAELLSNVVNAYDGYVLNGLTLKDNNGHSAEIDHILVSSAGVFIIETKSDTGVVSGQKEDSRWHVRKGRGQVGKDPRNPLKQNQGHIYFLKKLCGERAPWMTSMVIYPFANIVLVSDLVYNLVTAEEYLEERFTSPRYSLEEVEDIYQEFVYLKKRYGISKEEHVQTIEKSHR